MSEEGGECPGGKSVPLPGLFSGSAKLIVGLAML